MSSTTIFILVPHGFCSLNLYVLLVKSGLIGEIQIVGETYIFIGWLPRFRWLNRIPIFMSDLQLYRHENCALHRLPKAVGVISVQWRLQEIRGGCHEEINNPTIRNWKNSDPTRLDISTTGVPSSAPSPRVHQSAVEPSTDALKNWELGISGTNDWGFSLNNWDLGFAEIWELVLCFPYIQGTWVFIGVYLVTK